MKGYAVPIMNCIRKKVFTLLCASVLAFFAAETYSSDHLLVVRLSGKSFDEVVRGMTDDFEGSFSVSQMYLNERSMPQDIERKIAIVKPRIVVLMDNKAINLYRKYQSQQKDTAVSRLIPSVSLMGVLVDKAIIGMQNSTGICYEVPIVTSAINLQSVLKTELRTVGVIHRDFMTDFIAQSSLYCKKEHIAIAPYLIDSKELDVAAAVSRGLKKLKAEQKINALWIPNDNILLKPDILRDAWIPFVSENRIPVIVGVDVLVDPQLDFGTFAVLPDHMALGSQAAQMIEKIRSNNWHADSLVVEPPLSIYKVINFRQARDKFKVTEKQLQNVDKIEQ